MLTPTRPSCSSVSTPATPAGPQRASSPTFSQASTTSLSLSSSISPSFEEEIDSDQSTDEEDSENEGSEEDSSTWSGSGSNRPHSRTSKSTIKAGRKRKHKAPPVFFGTPSATEQEKRLKYETRMRERRIMKKDSLELAKPRRSLAPSEPAEGIRMADQDSEKEEGEEGSHATGSQEEEMEDRSDVGDQLEDQPIQGATQEVIQESNILINTQDETLNFDAMEIELEPTEEPLPSPTSFLLETIPVEEPQSHLSLEVDQPGKLLNRSAQADQSLDSTLHLDLMEATASEQVEEPILPSTSTSQSLPEELYKQEILEASAVSDAQELDAEDESLQLEEVSRRDVSVLEGELALEDVTGQPEEVHILEARSSGSPSQLLQNDSSANPLDSVSDSAAQEPEFEEEESVSSSPTPSSRVHQSPLHLQRGPASTISQDISPTLSQRTVTSLGSPGAGRANRSRDSPTLRRQTLMEGLSQGLLGDLSSSMMEGSDSFGGGYGSSPSRNRFDLPEEADLLGISKQNGKLERRRSTRLSERSAATDLETTSASKPSPSKSRSPNKKGKCKDLNQTMYAWASAVSAPDSPQKRAALEYDVFDQSVMLGANLGMTERASPQKLIPGLASPSPSFFGTSTSQNPAPSHSLGSSSPSGLERFNTIGEYGPIAPSTLGNPSQDPAPSSAPTSSPEKHHQQEASDASTYDPLASSSSPSKPQTPARRVPVKMTAAQLAMSASQSSKQAARRVASPSVQGATKAVSQPTSSRLPFHPSSSSSGEDVNGMKRVVAAQRLHFAPTSKKVPLPSAGSSSPAGSTNSSLSSHRQPLGASKLSISVSAAGRSAISRAPNRVQDPQQQQPAKLSRTTTTAPQRTLPLIKTSSTTASGLKPPQTRIAKTSDPKLASTSSATAKSSKSLATSTTSRPAKAAATSRLRLPTTSSKPAAIASKLASAAPTSAPASRLPKSQASVASVASTSGIARPKTSSIRQPTIPVSIKRTTPAAPSNGKDPAASMSTARKPGLPAPKAVQTKKLPITSKSSTQATVDPVPSAATSSENAAGQTPAALPASTSSGEDDTSSGGDSNSASKDEGSNKEEEMGESQAASALTVANSSPVDQHQGKALFSDPATDQQQPSISKPEDFSSTELHQVESTSLEGPGSAVAQSEQGPEEKKVSAAQEPTPSISTAPITAETEAQPQVQSQVRPIRRLITGTPREAAREAAAAAAALAAEMSRKAVPEIQEEVSSKRYCPSV